ncbi:HIT family protein [Fonticella tunisiensis]|uniref:Diadenosine tetraphosphate (Ap4A) HIT family hydrolase n=1 Tax=Fonticella tunisiensis TaxID=1096341 RepID=A0A4R7K5K5_9CLOT|nr:HIT family protein [Fonticella tunisiensis]TDT46069.1 diadenosine tetraphosphate (Ap4A) HIT family hydrolase [Fonticella tunisiensis]
MGDCLFCNIYKNEKDKIIAENELAFAIYDAFPVNEGHVLVIPKRHFDSFFDAAQEEISAIYDLLHKCKVIIDNEYKPTGYNVGVNIGYDGGQTIFHLHVHLIPRYKGDVENPKGGVRRLKPQLVHYEG